MSQLTGIDSLQQLYDYMERPWNAFHNPSKSKQAKARLLDHLLYRFQQIIPQALTSEQNDLAGRIHQKLSDLALYLPPTSITHRMSSIRRTALPTRDFSFVEIHPGFNRNECLEALGQQIAFGPRIRKAPPLKIDPLQKVMEQSPPFAGYQIKLPQAHQCQGVVLTGLSQRPANLFFSKLLNDPSCTTLPGSGKLFAFCAPQASIRETLHNRAAKDPSGVIAFSAKGESGLAALENGSQVKIDDLATIYGDKTYRISNREIVDILESQRIYTSPLMPLPFYKLFKAAMMADAVVVLPGGEGVPLLLKELKHQSTLPHVAKLLCDVEQNPVACGFKSEIDYQTFSNLTLYQIGAMVVKSEDYRVFIDGDGKILERQPGEKDTIRLINACGIRGVRHPKTGSSFNARIMKETFRTALVAAKEGFVVFPAVGMGVWGGDPDLYWRAFLDAVIGSADAFDGIFVNPGHQKTRHGKYEGCTGGEFKTILDEYLAQAIANKDAIALARLRKIHNLYEAKKDLLQLAYNLKKAFPEKNVSLFNASDPDVTLGNHVGQYVNNMPHTLTTEENYTASGTNGLCFPGITGVHNDPSRLIEGKQAVPA